MEQARIAWEKARLEADVPEQLRPRREHQEKQLALEKSRVELDKAREELEASRRAAEAELDELRLALANAKREVRVAEEAIEALTLRAPTDGILVISENRREGRKFQTADNVHVGLAVASIPELTSMQVQARLSDVDDGKIAVGMRAVCRLDTYPDIVLDGEVIEIMPIAKEQGRESRRRAFIVTIRLDETDPERMRPGMSVRAEVLPRPPEDVLLVPRTALAFDGETPRALHDDGSTVEVVLGPCNASTCVVEEGLREGQRVRSRG
jgi:multidrug resistance efflux pump